MSLVIIVYILAILLSVVMVFFPVPYGASGLAVLGLIIGFMGVSENQRMIFMVTAVALTVSADALNIFPAVGEYLTAFFNNAAVVLQAGVLAVLLMTVKDALSEK